MLTKQQAQAKVDSAAAACSKVQAKWTAAAEALGGTVGVNGYGIFRDRFELRDKLQLAQKNIQEALKELDGIAWPSSDECDLL